jgi:hypothetical protein
LRKYRFMLDRSKIGREKRAGGLSSLLCVAVYGLGSFMNGKRREAFAAGAIASHKLSHSAAGSGMRSADYNLCQLQIIMNLSKVYK